MCLNIHIFISYPGKSSYAYCLLREKLLVIPYHALSRWLACTRNSFTAYSISIWKYETNININQVKWNCWTLCCCCCCFWSLFHIQKSYNHKYAKQMVLVRWIYAWVRVKLDITKWYKPCSFIINFKNITFAILFIFIKHKYYSNGYEQTIKFN